MALLMLTACGGERQKKIQHCAFHSTLLDKLKLRTQLMAEELSCAPSETVSVCFSGGLLSNSNHCCVTTAEYKWSSAQALLDRQHYLKDTFRHRTQLLELLIVYDPFAARICGCRHSQRWETLCQPERDIEKTFVVYLLSHLSLVPAVINAKLT